LQTKSTKSKKSIKKISQHPTMLSPSEINSLNSFTDTLDNIPINKNESPEAFINRIAKHIHTKRKK